MRERLNLRRRQYSAAQSSDVSHTAATHLDNEYRLSVIRRRIIRQDLAVPARS